MELKISKQEREKHKALGEVLVAECRSEGASPETIDAIIKSGADVNYADGKPLYWAAKKHNFDAVKFLIKNGALNVPIAKTYISAMCDGKGFNDEMEPEFFAILDLARAKSEGGDYMTLFTPYINYCAKHGFLNKLLKLKERYYLTDSEIVDSIFIRIIFEIILNGYDDVLQFIERRKNWITQEAFDLAVGAGEWIALEYIMARSSFDSPGETAVAQAVYDGNIEVLKLIESKGYDFKRNPLFLEKAARAAFSHGTRSIEYLMTRGYGKTDSYKGKTLLQHAEEDRNYALLNWLKR